MALNDTLLKALSEQITLELESSIVYLQLGIALEDRDLPGMASWMRLQSDEERDHAAKFIAHVTDRGGRPQIGPIGAPQDVGDSVIAAFEASLAHEQKVSESIRELYRLAQAEGDIDAIPLCTGSSKSRSKRRRRSPKSSVGCVSSTTMVRVCCAWTPSWGHARHQSEARVVAPLRQGGAVSTMGQGGAVSTPRPR